MTQSNIWYHQQYYTASTEAGLKSDIKITEDTPYLTDELWGIRCEDFFSKLTLL